MKRFDGLSRDDLSLLMDRFGSSTQDPLSLEQAAKKYGLRREDVRARENRALFQLDCLRAMVVALKFEKALDEVEDDPRDMYPSLYARGA